MNITWMRWIDHKVGNVVCSAFAVAKQISAPFTAKPETVRKIAVMKFFGMGSIVVASPSLIALREAYPNAEIIFVTFKANKEILNILGLTDRNIFIDNSSLKNFVKTTAQAAYELRRAKIDLAIDFEFFAKFPLVLSSLANVPMKAGFHLTLEPWRRTLLDVKGYYNHYFHTKDIFLSLVYLMTTNDLYYVDFDAFRKKYTYPKITVGEAEKKKVDALLAERGYRPGQRLILVNANAAAELAPEIRKWPEERYSDLARRIRAEYDDAFVAFVGAPSEKEYTDRLAKAAGSKEIVSLAGAVSIRELIALISKAAVFITNDSGPMHLACLVDVPIIGLFFAESPVLFAPLAEKAVSISPNLYSIPLFTVYTGKKIIADENVASRTVSVDRVMGVLEQMLEPVSGGRDIPATATAAAKRTAN